MKQHNQNEIAFTFATSEVNKLGQNFIKIAELFTGKLKLKKLYDQYLIENNPPENFWQDAVKKLKLKINTHYHTPVELQIKGRLIVVANHAFGVADGVSICSIISKFTEISLNSIENVSICPMIRLPDTERESKRSRSEISPLPVLFSNGISNSLF